MTASTSCLGCGSSISSADRFGGVCGADLSARPKPAPLATSSERAEPPVSRPANPMNRTMLGVPPPQGSAPGIAPMQAPAAAAPTPVARPTPAPAASPILANKAVPQKTMLGMSAPLIPRPGGEPAPAAAPVSARGSEGAQRPAASPTP